VGAGGGGGGEGGGEGAGTGGGFAHAQDSVKAGLYVAAVGSVQPRFAYVQMPLLNVAYTRMSGDYCRERGRIRAFRRLKLGWWQGDGGNRMGGKGGNGGRGGEAGEAGEEAWQQTGTDGTGAQRTREL
jgi:hypothetical protein